MRGQKLKSDVLTSGIFAVAKTIVLFWIINIAGSTFSPVVLGIFLLGRRIASTAANLFQLGASQTIRRYISMNAHNDSAKYSYAAIAAIGWVFLILLILPISYLGRHAIAYWFFPQVTAILDTSELAFWTVAISLAFVLSFVAGSTLIAERRIFLGNAIDFVSVGGLLLLGLYLPSISGDLVSLFRFQTLGIFGFSGSALIIYVALTYWKSRGSTTNWKEPARTFITYGFPRTFVTVLDMGILLVGPWLLRSEPSEAGYLIIALTLARTVQAALQPITQIASVVTARYVEKESHDGIAEGANLILGMALLASLVLTVVAEPWMQVILQLWLGDVSLVQGVMHYFAVILWCTLPFATFQALKGIIEMRWHRPYNLITLSIGIAVHVFAYYSLLLFTDVSNAMRFAVLAAFWTVGAITLWWMRNDLMPTFYWGGVRLAGTTLVLFGVNAGIVHCFPNPIGLAASLFVTGGLVVAACKNTSVPFISEIRALVFPGKSLAEQQVTP